MFWQAILLLLDFSFPKFVEVAVSINRNRFIFAGAKGSFRCIARPKGSALTAILSFNINPLNVVLLGHGMSCFADPYINGTVIQIHKSKCFSPAASVVLGTSASIFCPQHIIGTPAS